MAEEPATKGDDFKRITGIGPAIEHRLHEAGILTFAHLAAMSPAELADHLDDMAGMSASRIAQQEWAAQARDLVPTDEAVVEQTADAPGNGQHYATFNIELLFDNENNVRRTRSVYIQGREEEVWAGWDRQRLMAFMEQQSGLEVETSEEREQAGRKARDETAAAHRAQLEGAPTEKREPAPAFMRPSLDVAQRYALEDSEVDLARMKLTRVARGEPESETERPAAPREERRRVGSLAVIPAGEELPRRVLRHGDAFQVHVSFERHVRRAAESPTDYTAALFAQKAGSDHVEPVGEVRGTLDPGERDIELDGQIADPGTYRLEAEVTFAGAMRASHVRGEIIHVY